MTLGAGLRVGLAVGAPNRLLSHASELPVVELDVVRGRPLRDGATKREVGQKIEVPEATARDRTRLVSLLQPALDAWPIVRVAGGNHHRIFHELHGDGAQEVGRCRGGCGGRGCRLAAVILDADLHLRVNVHVSTPTSHAERKN